MSEKNNNIFSKYVFKLSPSKISKFFSYNCDRHFVFNNLSYASEEETNQEIGTVTSDIKIGSDGFSAYVGNKWEEIVVKKLIKNSNVDVFDCYEDNKSLIDVITDYCEKSEQRTLYIYQSSFSVYDDSFLGFKSDAISKYNKNIDKKFKIMWSQVRPDLLVLEKNEQGDVTIHVSDVKFAKRAHLSH